MNDTERLTPDGPATVPKLSPNSSLSPHLSQALNSNWSTTELLPFTSCQNITRLCIVLCYTSPVPVACSNRHLLTPPPPSELSSCPLNCHHERASLGIPGRVTSGRKVLRARQKRKSKTAPGSRWTTDSCHRSGQALKPGAHRIRRRCSGPVCDRPNAFRPVPSRQNRLQPLEAVLTGRNGPGRARTVANRAGTAPMGVG